MRKISALLGLVGVALLTVSFLPWPAAGSWAASALSLTPTPGAAMPAGMAAQGAALFRAKGCATCHRHEAVSSGTIDIGPDLSHYNADSTFLRRWLQDPAAVRPDARMPNLQLAPAEIEALIAFLGGTSRTDAKALPGDPLAACPVTRRPDQPFRPPPPYPSSAPYEGKFWYGTEALWTMLPEDGRWDQLARGEKVWWWRKGYDGSEEPQPELGVAARRLDGPAPTVESGPPATNGYHQDFNWAMLVGIQVTSPGCWEITGHYHDETLSFVVWVAPPTD